jgi:hypothetical protein
VFTDLIRILRPTYLEASLTAGYFLSEEAYEWQIDMASDEPDQALIAAAKRWRQSLEFASSTSRGIPSDKCKLIGFFL